MSSNSRGEYRGGIKITIPDGTPEFQLEMVEGMIKVLTTFARAAGEEKDLQLEPLLKAKIKLEAEIKANKGLTHEQQ